MSVVSMERPCWKRACTLATAPSAGTPRCARLSSRSAARSTSSICSKPWCGSTLFPRWYRPRRQGRRGAFCRHQAPGATLTIQQEADRCRMPYVNQRWLGSTLTNWTTIKQRIDYLLRLERRYDAGEFRNLSKKEQLAIRTARSRNSTGASAASRPWPRLPDLLFVVDTHLEDLAVNEANKLHSHLGHGRHQFRS